MNGFQVRPVIGPREGELAVLDTFHVTESPVLQSSRESFVPQTRSVTSSESWIRSMHENIERELSNLPPTKVYDELRLREDEMDLELRKRRAAAKILKPTYPILTIDMKDKTKMALSNDDETIMITKFGIDFKVHDLGTLRSPKWLNDEVINFYMQLIKERSESNRGSLPSIHIFSSFFFPKLRDRGYDSVRASTRKITPSVLTFDMVLLPIHLGLHWCMAAIDFRARSITYYDSLHGNNVGCLESLRNWIAEESRDKLREEFNFSGWTESCPKDIPAQHNSYDCGVFALAYAEHLSRDAPFSFSQSNMNYWRDRISYEILTGKLL